MNNIIKHLTTTLGVTILVFSHSAMAHEGPHANPGYVGDRSGHIEQDGSRNCLHTSIFDKAKHGIAFCGDAVEVAEKAEVMPEPEKRVVLHDVSLDAKALFDVDKSDIRPQGRAALDELAYSMRKVKRVDAINIVGHTDNTGKDDYNQALSERRAHSVRHYLIDRGLNASVINASGRGESTPVADNSTREGRQKNRRVAISVEGVK